MYALQHEAVIAGRMKNNVASWTKIATRQPAGCRQVPSDTILLERKNRRFAHMFTPNVTKYSIHIFAS